MVENVFYDFGKDKLVEFINNEWEGFPSKITLQLINFFSSIAYYEEEGVKIRPNILFTNNIDALVKMVPNGFKLPVFSDTSENLFRIRLKALIPFCKHGWGIYLFLKDDKINYGIYKALNSIKESSFNNIIFDEEKEIDSKINGFVIYPTSTYAINITSLHKNCLNISFSLETKKVQNFKEEIGEFVNASFSKLRTTKAKLKEIKTLYLNIFDNVFKNVHGCICVVVDKDYEEKGLFEDGIWLKEPIGFSKLFTKTNSYNEQKIMAFSQLFIDMLNHDGITIIDNAGRIRAFNVFVETDKVSEYNILGGARKRAAFTIINSRNKKIKGVYFQSQEGEMFYQRTRSTEK